MKEDAKQESTQMTRFGMTSTELGNALVDEAAKREKKTIIDKATAEIQNLYKIMDNSRDMVDWHTYLIALNEQRLEAIKAGEFTLSDDGKVKYKDHNLETAFRGYSLQRV